MVLVLLAVLGLNGSARADTPVAITCGKSSKHAVAITFDDGQSDELPPRSWPC